MAKTKGTANGNGSIYQRKRDGKYVCEIVASWTPDGKKKVIRHAADTFKECQEWRNKRLVEKDDSTLPEPTNQTLAEYLAEWLDSTVRLTAKPATLQNYRDMVAFYIVPRIGKVKLSKLTAQQIQRMHADLIDTGRSGRTCRLVHAVLHRALEQAKKARVINFNPTEAVDPPKAVQKEMQALAPDQVKRFITEAKDERLHAMFILAVTVGPRIGELLGLRWGDVDLEAGKLTIRNNLTYIKGEIGFGTPKTKNSKRDIDPPAVALAALRRWHKEQAAERMTLGLGKQKDTDLVFSNPAGEPLTPSNVRGRMLPRVLDAARCPAMRFHDLRHSAASFMRFLGTDIETVSKILGHSNVTITLNLYRHVFEVEKKDVARRMDKFLSGL